MFYYRTLTLLFPLDHDGVFFFSFLFILFDRHMAGVVAKIPRLLVIVTGRVFELLSSCCGLHIQYTGIQTAIRPFTGPQV